KEIRSRIRHVKCDEAKPECSKCKSTGRKCDGYVPKQDPLRLLKGEQQEQISWAAARNDPFLSLVAPTSWKGTVDEFRSFDYFRVQTSEDLAYSLSSSLEELVLQTSHHHEAIKHAAIALGSLGETLRINSSANCGRKSIFWKRHDFACGQYYKAIKILQKDIVRNDQDSINFALISCFLFVIFEFLQGNDSGATTHLQSGLNILRQRNLLHADDGTATNGLSAGSRASAQNGSLVKLHPIQAEISRIFRILDIQATMWLDVRTFNPSSYIATASARSCEIVPESFASLDEACQDHIDLTSRVYSFRRYASRHDFAPTKAHVPASIYAERDFLLEELDIHRCRLATFLACRQTFAQHPEDPYRITALRINRKVTTLMLASYLEPYKSSFYAYSQPHFLQIVSLAALILRPQTSEARQILQGRMHPGSVELNSTGPHPDIPRQRSVFSSFAGLIQPLYFTAIKCPKRETARKAVELLETEPWREGSWDSAVMAKRARQRMQEPDCARGDLVVAGREQVFGACGEEKLSIEWPLATDPLITYPT
ncbi:MAG: hypothetical protein LQ338_006235, partial [Usnochroma carphineum]